MHDQSWLQSPIDSFVLASLEAARLTPSPRADRRTLIRRVYYDLIGLPPTALEIEAFESDRSPDAFARVVDRLLASPHYGERWGRHWLDVARYADTKDGVLMFGDDRVRPYAYTYRDYVIRAFNEDLGFDRFVHEQLAADLVAPKDQTWRLAAMGFLTLGRMFDNNYHDQIDDRIDTVTRGLPGLDRRLCALPRPQVRRDPHGRLLFAVRCLRQQRGAARAPADRAAGMSRAEAASSRSRRRRSGASCGSFSTASTSFFPKRRDSGRPTTWCRAATTPPDPLETAIFFLSLAPEDLRPQIVARWRRYLEQRVEPERSGLRPVARPDGAAGFRVRGEGRRDHRRDGKHAGAERSPVS